MTRKLLYLTTVFLVHGSSFSSCFVQEQEDVRLVLKAACDMLAELSAAHNPKNYSNLYAEIFTHLQQLPVRFGPSPGPQSNRIPRRVLM